MYFAFINPKYNVWSCFFLIRFFWGEYICMELLFGLQFVCIAKVHGVLPHHRSGASCFGCSMNAAQKPNPSFQLVCKLQKSGLLIKSLLHHHFCFCRVQCLLLQVFKIFSYCCVWLVQIDIFAFSQCYDFIRFYWQLALRQCYVPFFLNLCSAFCTIISVIWKLFPYELDYVFPLIDNVFIRLYVILCIWQIFSYLINVMYSGLQPTVITA